MTTLLKLLVLVVVIALLTFLGISFSKNNSLFQEELKKNYSFDYINISDSIYIIKKVNSIVPFYFENKTTALDFSKSLSCKNVINGGFFSTENTPSGLFYKDGEIISPLAKFDKQLREVISSKNNNLNIQNVDIFNELNLKDFSWAFQTGPIFLRNSKITNQEIENSTNGNGNYIRSFLGTIDNNEIFVGITLSPLTLKELGEKLMSNEEFQNKLITAVNLDGGSSVTLYSEEYKDFNYGISKLLPLFLCIN